MPRRQSIARRLRRATVVLAVLAPLAVPAAASADYYGVSCFVNQGSACLADQGRPHGLIQVVARNWGNSSNWSYTCAYAQTAAGNLRSYSGCSTNSWFRRSNLTSTDPNSYGYSFFYYGGPIWITTDECTPSSVGTCNALP